jgi:threonine synthase
VHAWSEDSPTIEPHHRVAQPDGIADAILRGDPTRAYPHVRRIVKESAGDMVSVSESEIRSARQLVEDNEGITPCFSASAAVAGLIRQRQEGQIKAEETILINLTGRDRSAMVSQQPGSDSLKKAVMLERDGGSYRPTSPIDAEIANLRFH